MTSSSKILLIEDNPGDARLIQEMLADVADNEPFDLDCVGRLSQGLERLSANNFGVVLLDLSLPDSMGLETFSKVYESAPQIPIIVLTGYDDEKLALTAVKTGAQDYLIKGDVDGPLLLRAMRYAMERKHSEHALRDSEAKYKGLFDSATDAVFLCNGANFIDCNAESAKMFGYTTEQLIAKGFDALTFSTSSDQDNSSEIFSRKLQAAAQGTPQRFEWQFVRSDGRVFDSEVNLNHVSLAGHTYVQAVVRDITERKQSEAKQKQLVAILEATTDFVGMADAHHRSTYINYAGRRMLGITADENFPNKRIEELSPAWARSIILKEGLPTATRDGVWTGETALLRRDGIEIPVSQVIIAHKNHRGEVEFFSTIARDISERKDFEEQLAYVASHDPLSELPNRKLLEDRTEHAMAYARRSNYPIALLFIDLDHFKFINDSLGHIVGDELIKNIARRLSKTLRHGDTVARLGGDEFVVILSHLENEEDVSVVAKKILTAIAQPQTINGYDLFTTASIGGCIYPRDGDDFPTLLKNADNAMYHAKESGRNNFQLYKDEMNARMVGRFEVESNLRKALEKHEFLLHYQPEINLKTGKIIGLEALLRWQRPHLELLGPTQFIPLAEETGLIVDIGEWVLRAACTQCKVWQDKGYSNLRLAVNLSARQFRQPDIVEMIAGILEELSYEPRNLELEITESLIMENAEDSIAKLSKLKEMGVHLSIDDFGTGYSSLNYLKRFPIDTIKIDQSFVRDIATGENDGSIVKAIIALSHSMHRKVIAEGVETNEQLAFLISNGCDEMQGFLSSAPLLPDAVERLLQDDKCFLANPAAVS